MAGRIARYVRVGIDARTPPREAKFILTTNAVTLLTAVQALGLVALTSVVGLTIVPYSIAATIGGYALVYWLSSRRRFGAARALLALIGGPAIGIPCVLVGPVIHGEEYFFIAIAASWLLSPRVSEAALYTAYYVVVGAVVVVLYGEIEPMDPLPASALSWFPYVIRGAILLGLISYAWWSYRETADTDRLLAHERERSDQLLRNVLPEPIAERLKTQPGAIAERFPEATVLFADIVGFTPLTQKLPAERVVAILDELFSAFDDIAAKHGLEKIKTIGDAYMVVGGVPAPQDDHACKVALMALEMRAVIARFKPDGVELRLRIGIDSGPVIAGVIGKQKFLYDLWGDTVNTASRMESHGVVDEVHVTEATYERLRDRFELEARGAIQVKGKGEMSTYLVKRARETT